MSAQTVENWKPKNNPWLTCAPLMVASFMFVLDETIANVALPYMAGSFSVSSHESTWVLTSYLIASGIVIPSVDFFSKLLGRKNFFIMSILIFTISSFLCGITTSLPAMVITRILQGFGGGALLPLAQSMMLELFPLEKRAQSMALFGLVVVIAPILGPVIGGWITTNWSWPFIYFINVPIGFLAVFLANKLIEDPPYARKQPNVTIDQMGFFLLTGWLACMQIVLDKGNDADWFGSTWVCWLTFFTVIFMFCFFISQSVRKNTLIDLKVFKDANFSLGTFVQIVMQGVMLSSMAVLPQFLQGLMGYDAYLSGLAMMPRGIGALTTTIIVGILGNKLNPKLLVIVGMSLMGVSGLILGQLNLEIATMNIGFPNFLMGVGMAMSMIPIITLSSMTLTNEQMTNASGVQNLLKNLGGAIGTSVVTTILSRHAQTHQNFLIDNLTMTNDNFIERINTYAHSFLGNTDLINATNKASVLIYKQMSLQAHLWSFKDAFELCGIACFIVIPLLFFLKNIKKEDA